MDWTDPGRMGCNWSATEPRCLVGVELDLDLDLAYFLCLQGSLCSGFLLLDPDTDLERTARTPRSRPGTSFPCRTGGSSLRQYFLVCTGPARKKYRCQGDHTDCNTHHRHTAPRRRSSSPAGGRPAWPWSSRRPHHSAPLLREAVMPADPSGALTRAALTRAALTYAVRGLHRGQPAAAPLSSSGEKTL